MEMSSLFRRSVRGQDLVSRWGGDEFLFLLPKTDIRGGFLLAEKICRTVSERTYSADGTEIRLSTSIGVSAYSPGHNLEDCIKAADQALYRAKAKGRNQVAAMEFGVTLPES
jgi:diguanylate cyclase (GGDEF)-like protein